MSALAELRLPDRCVVMGIVNVTPDSFSDGGRWLDASAAIEHGLELFDEGADIVDVGGESTRPGADRVDADEECRRVLPVVAALSEAGVRVSIDTMRSQTATAAIGAGAVVVNDVSGGQADPQMIATVASARVPYVVMHWRGHSRTMKDKATYTDVVAEVVTELSDQIGAALDGGIAAGDLVIDPGIGFSKQPHHDWALLAHLDRLSALGFPLLIGASRKSFLGTLLADRDGRPRPALDREAATVAISSIAAEHGVWGVRVHDVLPTADAVRVAAAIRAGRGRRRDPVG